MISESSKIDDAIQKLEEMLQLLYSDLGEGYKRVPDLFKNFGKNTRHLLFLAENESVKRMQDKLGKEKFKSFFEKVLNDEMFQSYVSAFENTTIETTSETQNGILGQVKNHYDSFLLENK
jgi:hypothetical protein